MIVAFTGYKRSGKDTCANYLVEKYGFERFGFADPIRRFTKDVFGWDDNWIETHKEEIDPQWGISYRQVAQIMGTEWMQFDLCNRFPIFKSTTDREVWSNRFKVIYQKDVSKKYVISDLRFPHEAKTILSLGGHIIRVTRDGASYTAHESEKHIDELPRETEIANDSTIESLEKKLDCLMKYL